MRTKNDDVRLFNIVAKYAWQYNTPTIQKDRKNTYQRKPKHNRGHL